MLGLALRADRPGGTFSNRLHRWVAMRPIAIVAAFAFCAQASAQNGLGKYTSLCEGAEATGFDWENKNWERSNWRPSKLIVAKHSDTHCHGVKPTTEDVFTFKERAGCYQVVDFGQEAQNSDGSPKGTRWCIEHFSADEGGAALIRVSCKALDREFTFKPSGAFIKWFGLAALQSDIEYKDSIGVEHGRCSVVSGAPSVSLVD